MKIYLIRHGETDWNLQGRFQGREDIPLNENGRLQAQRCGQVLQGEHFEAIITSPLSRAKKTAEIIAGNIGVENIIVEPKITERDFSKVSGMTPKEREAFYASGEEDDKEPWDQLCNRMMSSIKKYVDEFTPKNILIVSHGASINSVISILTQGELGTRKTILKNTCINIINYENAKMKLEQYNLSADEYKNLIFLT
jgi:uncharacterized phosphatase